MRLETPFARYGKGMLLEAAMLNRDFSLAHFLIEKCATGRLSDGIIEGLEVRPREGELILGKGVFKLGGALGWSREDLPLEIPPKGNWRFLTIARADENSWDIEWKLTPDSGDLVLCRSKILDPANLREASYLNRDAQPSIETWLKYLQGVDYIQAEYAMAASFGERPTLLPVLQRFLARFARSNDLKIQLLNGLFPILDFYDTDDWQEGLDALIAELTEAPPRATKQESRSII